MFKNILVAWDGSEHAKRGLAEAVVLNHATVPVLVVHDSNEALPADAAQKT